MFDLEKAIADWRRQMLAAGIQTPVPLEELESHLRQEIEQQTRSGLNEQQAFAVGVRQIGEGGVLKREFARVGGTRESQLRKFVLTAGMLNMMFGTLWILMGYQAIHVFWWRFGPGTVFEVDDFRYLCITSGIGFYGAITGVLAIVGAIRLFMWQRSGITLTTTCALLTVLGVLIDAVWRTSQFGVGHVALESTTFLSYPVLVLVLCHNPKLKEQYV